MAKNNAEYDGQVVIEVESDIVAVRKTVRQSAMEIGFNVTDVTRIVTAASELARNVFRFAGKGIMYWRELNSGPKKGIELIFVDQGPGIADIKKAMNMGYTTGGGLGLGLPGTKRLMDEMDIQSAKGKGTTIKIGKWLATS